MQGLGDSWVCTDTNTAQQQLMYSTDFRVKPKGKLTTVSDIGAYNFQYNSFYATYGEGSNPFKDIGSFTAMKSTSPYILDTHSYEGKCFALPIALVHRRNQGMYHNVYNPNGTKLASDGLDCFRTTISFTSIGDCFDPAKLLTGSGYIGTVSGRPDGLFYDQVHEGDITDLRNSSKKVEDYNRLISREFNKLVAGTTRGKEGEWHVSKSYGNGTNLLYDYNTGVIRFYTPSTLSVNLQIGDTINVSYFDGVSYTHDRVVITIVDTGGFTGYSPIIASVSGSLATPQDRIKFFIFGNKTSRTKSNTLLHCDIIGNPTNYPTAWKESGVFGTPLIVAEDGTSLLPNGTLDSFKLSRKANATPLLCLRSTDNGATWVSFTPVFSATSNTLTLTDEPAGNIVLVYYQTKTSMAAPVANSEVLELGEVWAGNSQYTTSGGAIVGTLLNKVSTGSLTPVALFNGKITNFKFYNAPIEKLDIVSEYKPAHSNIPSLGTTASPAVKVLPYLTRLNGKAYLNLVFKEMKHNGTSWGDDSKFNIVDNVSTTTDNNAQTVLIGQKTVELPYFIGADE